MIGAPVFHVNGEDVAALMAVADIAYAWRERYGSDVLIDMVCYRANGHNELDEPRFTQPVQYAAIDARPSLRERLADELAADRTGAAERGQAAAEAFRAELDAAYNVAGALQPNARPSFQAGWDQIPSSGEADLLRPVVTGLATETLAGLAESITTIPDGLNAHSKVRRFYDERRVSLTQPHAPINFATAEALALASLLGEGVSVRMSGQDTVRGAFTQRHLRVHDMDGGEDATPLANAAAGGARFEAINSPLSEYAVLGFEYGHSLAAPDKLTLWEAQFGDFLNGAQIVLDQYISSAEAKWVLRSGLVMLLPHGLEGQGPDHSSARIERILQLCANGNMLVANPSTPASYFHLIRRQIVAPWRKPLAVIAPKSLLRLKTAASLAEDFVGETRFLPVIAEQVEPGAVERVVLCSGKVFYDLRAAVEAGGLGGRISLIRIEQLYPLDVGALTTAINHFNVAASLVWCQEEPQNQGAWQFIRDQLLIQAPAVGARIAYCGRRALPVAAGGSIERHEAEQQALVASALGIS
jgi:2-oxoglutarate dehydrogenase E1 component